MWKSKQSQKHIVNQLKKKKKELESFQSFFFHILLYVTIKKKKKKNHILPLYDASTMLHCRGGVGQVIKEAGSL